MYNMYLQFNKFFKIIQRERDFFEKINFEKNKKKIIYI